VFVTSKIKTIQETVVRQMLIKLVKNKIKDIILELKLDIFDPCRNKFILVSLTFQILNLNVLISVGKELTLVHSDQTFLSL